MPNNSFRITLSIYPKANDIYIQWSNNKSCNKLRRCCLLIYSLTLNLARIQRLEGEQKKNVKTLLIDDDDDYNNNNNNNNNNNK